MDHSMFATNCLSYHFAGDYQIPDISIADSESLGVWGRMRKQYLNGHRPLLFAELLLSEKLYTHCFEIECACVDRLERIIHHLAEKEGITEALKATDQLEWVRRMNSIRNRAEEIVLRELVYC